MIIKLSPTDDIETPGHDYGPGKKTLWHRTPRTLVMKVEGHSDRYAPGGRGYFPAHFYVFTIQDEALHDDGSALLSVEWRTDFPVTTPDSSVTAIREQHDYRQARLAEIHARQRPQAPQEVEETR